MTRVLMTADTVGGVWTYAMDLAEGLGRRGFEIILAVLGPPPTQDQRQAAQRLPGLTMVETGLPLDWTADGPEALEAAGVTVARLARERGAEIVHLNSPALAAAARFEAPVVGACHSCLASWWATVRGGPLPEDFAWRVEALAAGYAACDLLTAPSRAFAEQTWRIYGHKPLVVRNGRNPAAAPAGERRPEAIAAGRLWDPAKGADVFDAAAARLDRPLFAAGPLQGPQGQAVELRHAQPLGRLGPDALASRLAESRAFVSPALYEPFGLSVLEAAQAGCALVLSDIPSFRELWNGAALFVPPRDPVVLAGAVDRALGDPAVADRLARAAQKRAALYTADAMVEGMAQAYRLAARTRRFEGAAA